MTDPADPSPDIDALRRKLAAILGHLHQLQDMVTEAMTDLDHVPRHIDREGHPS